MKYGKKPRLLTMLTLTFLFFLAEIITGYLTNSMALVADSFHMLSDVLSIFIGFLAVYYSGKKSKRNTYDWARAEVLGAMANAVFLMALVFTIVIAAVQRLIIVEEITQPLLVLGVGAAGLVINLIGLFIFHDHGHSHGGHGHSHGLNHAHENHDDLVIAPSSSSTQEVPTVAPAAGDSNHTIVIATGVSTEKTDQGKPKKKSSASHMNMQAVFLHVLGDALGSVVVIISALVVHFVQEDWRFYIDPIMSLITSIIISCTTIPLLRRASMILLQNPPRSIDVDAVREKVSRVPGVLNIHDLHVWQLSGNCTIATVHVILKEGCNFGEIAPELKHIFHEVDIHATTIQPEYMSPKRTPSLSMVREGEDVEATFCECDLKDEGSREEHFSDLSMACHRHHADKKAASTQLVGASNADAAQCTGDDSDSSDTCLMSCVSDDCLPHMCCGGVRQRAKRSFTNPGYTEVVSQQGCGDADVEACDRI